MRKRKVYHEIVKDNFIDKVIQWMVEYITCTNYFVADQLRQNNSPEGHLY